MSAAMPIDANDLAGLDGLTADSREVGPGMLFAALPGSRQDGRTFIADAVTRGAAAILAPLGTTLPADAVARGVRLITDANPRRRFALMAAAHHKRQPDLIAAVTGTNGKTSTVQFVRQIWQRLGRRAASLGTLGVITADGAVAGSLTTPDPASLHQTLAGLARDGVTHAALEASSHGLDQYRLDGVRVAVAGFTNLSRDHLDYHPDMEAYFLAKARLFTELLSPGGTAVINADDAYGQRLIRLVRAAGRQVMTYGYDGEDLRIAAVRPYRHGIAARIGVAGQETEHVLPVLGTFQLSNALCALGLVLGEIGYKTGPAVDMAVTALGAVGAVRGRLETVTATAGGAPILVDYAHTPDALETVLVAVRPHVAGKLVCVFGCGGDRDPGKRPDMGRIAARLADIVIVTDDNPRTEDPAEIRRQILAACPNAIEIGDRAQAIGHAVGLLDGDDVLVIAGKGHESGQIIGDRVLPFDDATVARDAATPRHGQGRTP